jgi:hypothetical protein
MIKRVPRAYKDLYPAVTTWSVVSREDDTYSTGL